MVRASDCFDLQDPSRPILQCATVSASELAQKRLSEGDDENGNLRTPSPSQSTLLLPPKESILTKANALGTKVGRTKMNNIDLNNAYDDSQDRVENLENSDGPVNLGKSIPDCSLRVYQDPHKYSPPQASGNSGSTSSQSPSSSSGEAQVCVILLRRILLLFNLGSMRYICMNHIRVYNFFISSMYYSLACMLVSSEYLIQNLGFIFFKKNLLENVGEVSAVTEPSCCFYVYLLCFS